MKRTHRKNLAVAAATATGIALLVTGLSGGFNSASAPSSSSAPSAHRRIVTSSKTGVINFLVQGVGCTWETGQLYNGFNFVVTNPKVMKQIDSDTWHQKVVRLQYIPLKKAPVCADSDINANNYITIDGKRLPPTPNKSLVISVSPAAPSRR